MSKTKTGSNKNKDKIELPLVVICWGDAWFDGSWIDDDEDLKKDHKQATCYSVGWMVQNTIKGVTLVGASSPSENSRIGGGLRQFIPKGMIQNIEVVRVDSLGINKKKIKITKDVKEQKEKR